MAAEFNETFTGHSLRVAVVLVYDIEAARASNKISGYFRRKKEEIAYKSKKIGVRGFEPPTPSSQN